MATNTERLRMIAGAQIGENRHIVSVSIYDAVVNNIPALRAS